MSKLFLVAAVAALLAVAVVAEGEAAENFAPFGSTEMQCYRELEESSLDACQQVMRYMVYMVPGQMHPKWSTRLHARCCQQLLGVRRECRHAAIRGLVREYEQQQAMVPPEEGSGETVEQRPEQGWYGSQTTQHHQQQQGQGCQCGPTEQEQQGDRPNRKSSYGCPGQHTAVGRQPATGHELGETAQQQEGQGYGLPSVPHFSAEQQAAGLRLVKARQFAAQLPVMCRFDQTARPRGRGDSSAGLY